MSACASCTEQLRTRVLPWRPRAPRASLQSIEMNQTPELVQPVTFSSILLVRNRQHYSAFTHPLIHPTQYSRALGAHGPSV